VRKLKSPAWRGSRAGPSVAAGSRDPALVAGQDYKNYILSLMFYKRLCDQWENEADEAIAEQERQQGRSPMRRKLFSVSAGHTASTIPDGSRWGDVLAPCTNLGETLTDAMKAVANANEELRGVFKAVIGGTPVHTDAEG
jgi:type I restriction-modification system DNA methylase subunit